MMTDRDASTCCCYCKFGDFPEKKNPEDGWTSDNESGICRRHSPRPFSISEKRLDAKGTEAYKMALWPTVDIADFCGEWEKNGEIVYVGKSSKRKRHTSIQSSRKKSRKP